MIASVPNATAAGRIIRCPACNIQYSQDAGTGRCSKPGADLCASRRRWEDYERPDDGLIDAIAVEYAARGIRVVRLSPAEAAEALRQMWEREPAITDTEAAMRLGVPLSALGPIAAAAGLAFTDEPARQAAG